MNTQKIIPAIATQIMLVAFSIFLPLRAVAQSTQPTEADQDNIYHEDENLPDDADVFPRMGHTAGTEQENNNCRASAWGSIITTVPGNAFVEIDNRTVDRTGESWFQVTNLNCWIHESRIDLL
ncbi:hypothetical protein H6F93_21770 [Leptolyngbya sp. FACHB-671]|uniref:hypothetical protein n=1 Tax=Leptolyngbya sp. FACHB-671 TaxID=2692812 RepID=UPI001684A96B|nr:hypothetical protein [Leptolyngbya sp. FACHB-671]MBD2070111.1 hypothetical protein [Leptolyngbya sp. FACHB-671]